MTGNANTPRNVIFNADCIQPQPGRPNLLSA